MAEMLQVRVNLRDWGIKNLDLSDSNVENPSRWPALPEGLKLGCMGCNRDEEQVGHKINFMCANCVRSNPYIRYCSKECQVNDRPRHKKICGIFLDAPTTQPFQVMPARVVDQHWANVYSKLHHCRDIFTRVDPISAYKLIIDAYRHLDEVKWDYNPGFMSGEFYFVWLHGYSFEGLQTFLDKP